ncbi:MAG: SRPBCC family protein [Nocardioides sp.]|uniref:SRPBCC family protein n=1 Tax=Nocardioides sp. TaxID=35761 RepID=UPI0039E2391F
MPSFSNTRETVIAAPAASIHTLIDDFHAWQAWSPWEGLDADLARTYSGADRGVGAVYDWVGRKSGTGRMTLVDETPEKVVIDLDFLKPIKAHNVTTFALLPDPQGTRVTWTMTGSRNVAMHVAGRLFFDNAIGKDFDKGLAALKRLAETS